jgi:hypothetical protein
MELLDPWNAFAIRFQKFHMFHSFHYLVDEKYRRAGYLANGQERLLWMI